jgi:hypothetical protein
VIAKRKSGSSLGESGSSGEIERKIAPKGTQGKGLRKDKGKAPAESQGLQDPPEFPNGSCQVSSLFHSPHRYFSQGCLSQALHSCERCVILGFRCFLIPDLRRCAKCRFDKQKCIFPDDAQPEAQFSWLAAQAGYSGRSGPLTPRPRQPSAPSRPSGSRLPDPSTPTPGKSSRLVLSLASF